MTQQMFDQFMMEHMIQTRLLSQIVALLEGGTQATTVNTVESAIINQMSRDAVGRGVDMLQESSRRAGTGGGTQMPMPDDYPQPDPAMRRSEPPAPAAKKPKFNRGR